MLQYRRLVAALVLVASTLAGRGAVAQTQVAVEYRHVEWGYYFLTAFADEIAGLDAGAFGGVWKRTGQTFEVLSQPGPGAFPTCRFFSTSFAPRSSHFYTPFADECEWVKHNPDWQYESIAFYLRLPDAAGTCGAETLPLYRLYNDGMGGAPNHRYTTSRATFDDTRAAGWTPEGNPLTFAFACVTVPPAAFAAEGLWVGTTSANDTVRGYVLDDGSYYLVYTKPGKDEPSGVWQGTATASDGQFTSTDGLQFPIQSIGSSPRPVVPVSVTGTYVPRSSLSLTIGSGSAPVTLTATYNAAYETPASPAAAAGTYAGHSGHATGAIPTTFSVGPSGNLQGSNEACVYAGTMVPHASANLFDLTLTGLTYGCVFGVGSPILGIAAYDEATGRFLAFAPFGLRSDGYHLFGAR